MNIKTALKIAAREINIDELLDDLKGSFYHVRQTGIDEELFEVVSGFEALSKFRMSGR